MSEMNVFGSVRNTKCLPVEFERCSMSCILYCLVLYYLRNGQERKCTKESDNFSILEKLSDSFVHTHTLLFLWLFSELSTCTEPWTVNCELWTVNFELWTVNCELWTVNYELWTTVRELWIKREPGGPHHAKLSSGGGGSCRKMTHIRPPRKKF